MFARIQKYQHQFNTLDGLKVIAVLAMVIDHVGAYVLHHAEAWRTLGRLAAPLFFFIAGFVARPRQSGTWPVRNWREWFRPSLNLFLFGSVLTALNSAMHEDRLLLNILLVILLIKLGLERWDPLTGALQRSWGLQPGSSWAMNGCAVPGYCLNLAFWARPMLWADDSWRPGSSRSPS